MSIFLFSMKVYSLFVNPVTGLVRSATFGNLQIVSITERIMYVINTLLVITGALFVLVGLPCSMAYSLEYYSNHGIKSCKKENNTIFKKNLLYSIHNKK